MLCKWEVAGRTCEFDATHTVRLLDNGDPDDGTVLPLCDADFQEFKDVTEGTAWEEARIKCQAWERGVADCPSDAVVTVQYRAGYFEPTDPQCPEREALCQFHLDAARAEVDAIAMEEEGHHAFDVVAG